MSASASPTPRRPEIPERLGLCPEHADEFWYPLADGEGPGCPCCGMRMVIYMRVSDPVNPMAVA